MEHHTDNIIYYPNLRQINRKFLTQVKLVFFYGGDFANCTLLFTRDRRVFAYGDNANGELGLGHAKPVHEPKEIIEFRKIRIDTCKAGKEFIMVKTLSGKLFAWGQNFDGQLGCGNFRKHMKPVEVMDGVDLFSCGAVHTAALLQDGTLWSWGANHSGQLDQIMGKKRNLPSKIKENIVLVDCGEYSTAVLTNLYELYIWGKFDYEKLNATQVELPSGFVVSTFTCGPNSLVILNVEDKPYYYGKINDKWLWKKIECVKEPVLSVTNNYVCNTFPTDNPFCFKLLSGCVTVWSKEKVIETTLYSVPDACALFLQYDYTRTPIALPKHAFNDRARNFNKPFAGYTQEISVEGKSIYLDRRVLSKLPSYFLSQVGIEIPNHRVPINAALRAKINQLIQKDSFADMFIYLHTLHKDDEMDHEFALKMLNLIEGKPDREKRDSYLHEIANHKSLELNGLVYWNPETYIEDYFTPANCNSFINLMPNFESYKGKTYEDKDEMTSEVIYGDLLPSYSMNTAKNVLAGLKAIQNGDPNWDVIAMLRN